MRDIKIETGQHRWNSIGSERIQNMQAKPGDYVITEPKDALYSATKFTFKMLGDVQGKKILDFGCGWGDLSVYLAKQGADVMGIDIGEELINSAKILAKINNVHVDFQQMDITHLNLKENSFDIIIGIGVLHHLNPDLCKTALEGAHYVLKEGGYALFAEPVENSRIMDFLQNIIPVGEKSGKFYRPSILCRKAWKMYLETIDDRSMTCKELKSIKIFQSIQIKEFGFLERFERLIPNTTSFWQPIDNFIFTFIPPMKHFCRNVVVIYYK